MTENSTQPNTYRRFVVLDIETVSLNPADDKGALDALSGRIVCVGMLIDDGEQITETVIINEDERLILEQFWAEIKPTDVLVGHNVLDFDLLFIRQRSWILGIRPSREIDVRKYYTKDVIDTMQVWCNWFLKKGASLDNLGPALGCGSKTGHGTDVAHWWAKRDLKNIATYCMEDVRLTYRVFCKLMYVPPRVAGTVQVDSAAPTAPSELAGVEATS